MSTLQETIQALLIGLAGGATLALSAMGFSLVSQTTRGLHVAHGAVVVLGGLVTASMARMLEFGAVTTLVASAIVGVAAGIATGLGIEELVYRPLALRRAGPSVGLVASLGTFLAILGALMLGFGSDTRPPAAAAKGWALPTGGGPAFIGMMQAVEILAAAVIAGALWVTLRATPLGLLLRAQADDSELLTVLGGPVIWTRRGAAALGGGLAGVAGALPALDIGVDVGVAMPTVVAAATASLLVDAPLSVAPMAAGVALGVLQAQVGLHIAARWEPAVTYALLALALVRRSTVPDRVSHRGGQGVR